MLIKITDRTAVLRYVLLLMLLASNGFAAETFLEPDKLAAKLNYPAHKIKVTDWTDLVQGKTPNVTSSFLYEGEGRTFARIAVVVAEYRSLLTQTFEEEIQQAITKNQQANLPVVMTRIEFNRGGYGYTGLDAMGPGGSQYSVLATLPLDKIDIRITMTIPDDPPLERLKGADAYYDILESSLLNQTIVEIARATINNYHNKSTFEVAKLANLNNLDVPETLPSDVKSNSYESHPDNHGNFTLLLQNQGSISSRLLLISLLAICLGLFTIFKFRQYIRKQ